RPGKVPYEVLKQKIGEMTILEEAARLAINKTIDAVIKEHTGAAIVGQPRVDIVKLAPGNPLGFKVTVAMVPKITLGDYKNAKVKQKKADIKTAEADKLINDLREMKAGEAAVDREVRGNDKVTVDIKMFLDNVPVEGGQGPHTTVLMGKNYIVSGFDEKLIGAKKGETREFSLVYPTDYHMKNLAGKKVEFRVTVEDIFERLLPPLDDQFAAGFGLKTMAQLRENVQKTLGEQQERELAQAAEREMLEKIMAQAKFGDIPEMLVDHEAHNMFHELEHEVTDRGGNFADYLTSIKKSRDQLMLDLLPDAVKRVKISLLIREIAAAEKITVSPEEIEKQIKEMKAYYEQAGQSSPEAKKMAAETGAPGYRGYVANILASRKVIDKLREWNIEQ
ncbi:MAG: trigger factor, partial [Planctomycetes bacterium]|nr:trigger factor [Planctomycetota bacterium]